MGKTEQENEIAYPYQQLNYKMHLLMLTGQTLMEWGAATDQIKGYLFRAAVFMEIPEGQMNSYINYSTLMLNINDDKHNSHTAFIKCRAHGVNMSGVSSINRLIWRATRQNYSLEKYEQELERIKAKPRHYSFFWGMVGAGLVSGGLCKLFGADLIACICTFFCGMAGFLVRHLCVKYGFNQYACITLASFAATMLACFMQYTPFTATPIHPMIAASLFLIPGIPLLNAVDDMLEGYLVSGMTRAVNTLFAMAGIAFGIILALLLCGAGDITHVSIKPTDIFISHSFAAIIVAIGLGITFNMPRRFLCVAAIGAIMAVNLRNFLTIQLDANAILASFVGAAAVGIAAQIVNHWLQAPGGVLTIPAVIPLIPGVLLYRLIYALFTISSIDTQSLLASIINGVEAMTIITGLTIGITIPMLFFRPYLERYERQHIEELLVKRYLDD